MSDLKSQVIGLYQDMKVAVEKDPKALAGPATRHVLSQLATQAKTESQDKKVAEMVLAALGQGPTGQFTVTDALNLAGQLMRALR